jgi:hypothetical protein
MVDDVIADLRIMKIKQWMEKPKVESNGDWLLRRARLIQGCSDEGMGGWSTSRCVCYIRTVSLILLVCG